MLEFLNIQAGCEIAHQLKRELEGAAVRTGRWLTVRRVREARRDSAQRAEFLRDQGVPVVRQTALTLATIAPQRQRSLGKRTTSPWTRREPPAPLGFATCEPSFAS